MALMLTPAVWSAVPAVQNTASSLPTAGPTQQFAGGGFGGGSTSTNQTNATTQRQQFSGGPGEGSSVNTALIRYLEAHQGSAKYLVAVASSQEADAIILATNKPVMALGGFSGSDPILTTAQLATLVKNGTVRFFLLNGSGGGPGGGQSTLTTWITQHCTVVPTSQWQSTSTSSASSGTTQLYSCTTTN
jgi:4-amino-4-deoxy-L-arabinose transferase-like glycosyltransferase